MVSDEAIVTFYIIQSILLYMEQLSREKLLSSEVVRQQSRTILEHFKGYRERLLGVAGSIEYLSKQDGSLVTALDTEIESSLAVVFRDLCPHIPVYGEETVAYDATRPMFWLIDPIDGTKSFIQGTPTFSNMAALIENGKTRAAIIYNPSRNDVYEAYADEGAFRNGERIDMTKATPESVLCVKDRLRPVIEEIFSDTLYRFAELPSGGGDGFTKLLDGAIGARFQLHASGSAHDYAPGALLVQEAGGVIIPIRDDEYTWESNSFVACHPAFEHVIRQRIHDIKALERR